MKQINTNNEVVMFHGIKAYNGRSDSVYESIRKVDNLVSIGTGGGEICVADIPIGSLGVLVSGTLSSLFISDVWSEIGKDGKRQANGPGTEINLENILAGLPLTQARVNVFCEQIAQTARKSFHSYGTYSEGWMTPNGITGIWVNKYASKKDKKLARVLARRLKLQLFTVDGNTPVSSLTPAPLIEEQMEMEKMWFQFTMSLFDSNSWDRYGEERVAALKNRGVDSRKIEALFAYFKALELSNNDDEKAVRRLKGRISSIFNQTV